MIRISSTTATVLLLLLSQAPAWAQSTGAIAGTVEDDTGGVLPGVTVSVTVAGAPPIPGPCRTGRCRTDIPSD